MAFELTHKDFISLYVEEQILDLHLSYHMYFHVHLFITCAVCSVVYLTGKLNFLIVSYVCMHLLYRLLSR